MLQLSNKTFRQIVGIPIGSDPTPFFAALFLYYYEIKWIKRMKRSDIRRARRFANTLRVIDDITVLNEGSEFEQNFKDIRDALRVLVPFVQLKNVKNTHGGVLLLVKLQIFLCDFIKSNILSLVFFTFFKL